jgi:hypothetical protein
MSTEDFDIVVFVKSTNSDSHAWVSFEQQEQQFDADVPAY